ncbi:bacteriophage lambda head decoration protein D [Gottschalkia purinilytica]|uniref:Bacteriophage lambda head decoration protein D n=1 Tax=Gottschalkia purinilytica TaxID=1503 RepID=A0A0L0WAK8_GOTPU|nr:head decoration protein [Gottschalkia purinilytica]KNF08548.1 bacteriophage lambda head decoration protein D [Gottschalkia purinilytica]
MATDILDEFKPDGLIVDTRISALPKEIKIQKGQGLLLRGTVLGKIKENNLCVILDSTKTDGSQEPYCVLADDVETEVKDVVSTGYFTGIFDKSSLIFGGSDTVDIHEDKLRKLNIHVK